MIYLILIIVLGAIVCLRCMESFWKRYIFCVCVNPNSLFTLYKLNEQKWQQSSYAQTVRERRDPTIHRIAMGRSMCICIFRPANSLERKCCPFNRCLREYYLPGGITNPGAMKSFSSPFPYFNFLLKGEDRFSSSPGCWQLHFIFTFPTPTSSLFFLKSDPFHHQCFKSRFPVQKPKSGVESHTCMCLVHPQSVSYALPAVF